MASPKRDDLKLGNRVEFFFARILRPNKLITNKTSFFWFLLFSHFFTMIWIHNQPTIRTLLWWNKPVQKRRWMKQRLFYRKAEIQIQKMNFEACGPGLVWWTAIFSLGLRLSKVKSWMWHFCACQKLKHGCDQRWLIQEQKHHFRYSVREIICNCIWPRNNTGKSHCPGFRSLTLERKRSGLWVCSSETIEWADPKTKTSAFLKNPLCLDQEMRTNSRMTFGKMLVNKIWHSGSWSQCHTFQPHFSHLLNERVMGWGGCNGVWSGGGGFLPAKALFTLAWIFLAAKIFFSQVWTHLIFLDKILFQPVLNFSLRENQGKCEKG